MKYALVTLFLLMCLDGYGQTDGRNLVPFFKKVTYLDKWSIGPVAISKRLTFISSFDTSIHVIDWSYDSSEIGNVYLDNCDSMQSIKLLIKLLKKAESDKRDAEAVLDFLNLDYIANEPFFDQKKTGWQKEFRKAVNKYKGKSND